MTINNNAIVLGSRPGSGNIGEAIAQRLRVIQWSVTEDDCWDKRAGRFLPVNEHGLRIYNACVITLGHTLLTPMKEASYLDLRAVLYGSLELPLECARRYIQARKSDGRIIFIGSYAHNHPLTNCAAYCAAKAGLNAAVKELGWELTPDFLTHIVNPYHVPSTPMGRAVVEGMKVSRGMSQEEAEEYQRKDLRLNRHQTPQVIASVVAWLLTHDGTSEWTSGSAIDMYGGVR